MKVNVNIYRPYAKDGEGYIFTLCVSPHLDGGGVPGPGLGGGVPDPAMDGGGPRSQIFGGVGYPVSDFRGGPSLRFSEGGPRSQIFGGSPVSDFWGGIQSQ